MDILQIITEHAKNKEQIALRGEKEVLTYAELDKYSDRLAAWIVKNKKGSKEPVIVCGHKSVYMIVCFLAAVKAGRAYCPLDNSLPEERMQQIIENVKPSVIFETESMSGLPADMSGLVKREDILSILMEDQGDIPQEYRVRGDDVFYIIFTSGSSGTPKGVQITADCLNHYLDWSVTLGGSRKDKEGQVFLNQAPFSFDLSVMDLYTCLASGGTLIMMTREVQGNYQKLLPFLGNSKAKIWVSTPSFAELCLADKSFNQELMDSLELFLFCGETLGVSTAKKLQERFSRAKIINTYGPTESTVAVTGIEITSEMTAQYKLLPVGKVKPGSRIEIHKAGKGPAKEGEPGEIVILGDTVSPGYFNLPDKTKEVFFTFQQDGRTVRGYRTGDIGYLKEGQLYCIGRMNRQIKLHGYRIELQDIEQNLIRLPQIDHAVVIPAIKEGKINSLTAFVTGEKSDESAFAYSKKTKELLKKYLPDYMIPKKIIYLQTLPMNTNGKVDQQQLQEML